MICSYEGVIVPEDVIQSGYEDGGYAVTAIKDHRRKEYITVDSLNEDDCYGRYAQDPIDDLLVNAKILWRKNKMVLVSMGDIQQGDEIFVNYGVDYWRHRLSVLSDQHRERIIELLSKERRVSFQEEITVAESSEIGDSLLNVLPEGEPLALPAPNYLTRLSLESNKNDESDDDEGGWEETKGESGQEHIVEVSDTNLREQENESEDKEIELEDKVVEALSLENVDECEALADELQFLNDRKFEDDGRLFQIWQVRYDPESERIIGFRRPMSGRTHGEDACAYFVFGREGLYELSERYILKHPEEGVNVSWPKDNAEWARRQRECEDTLEIIESVETGGDEVVQVGRHRYSLVATVDTNIKLLIRVVTDKTNNKVIEQAVVPRSLRTSTMKMHHEGFGHMGANRMLETIRLRYFWTRMDKDIISHVNGCINCKLRKSYQRKPRVPIMKYDDTDVPLDRVHVDLTGPLPITKVRHKYIMVIKDYLTKYVWLIPLRSKNAMEVAEAFVGEFICSAGIPGRVVSDRGTEFVNNLLDNVSKIMNINRICTTPYNPRADGFVENHNKTLKDQLFHFVDTMKQDDWDVYLPTVQLMYNTTVSLATGYTPMLLMTGREARMPSFNHMQGESRKLRANVVENQFVIKMVETMRSYHDFALSQSVKNKERLNVRVREPLEFVEYTPGQKFMRVKRPKTVFKSADEQEAWKISAKLLERYEGPYTIIRKLNPVLYDAEVDGVVTRVHASNMKPF